jgi:hypothetical protein
MKDHHRVSVEGKQLGRLTSAMTERGRARMQAEGLLGINLPGLRDEMCASCACRAGTVPNGCLQTQLDLLKTVVEGKPFLCHAPKDGKACAGWVGARAEHVARPLPAAVIAMTNAWEYSPPDDVQ